MIRGLRQGGSPDQGSTRYLRIMASRATMLRDRARAADQRQSGSRPVVSYENRLASNAEWALHEGSMYFEGKSSVQQALHKITKRLEELGVSYAVAGGLALFRHGHRRFTEDVDILVTRRDLATIHTQLEGRGYLPPFPNSKHLRDTELGVKIEFLIAGDFPGDGKPKPVAFPEPSDAAVVLEGISYLSLPRLIELKLASGMTNPDRMKDLADVLELIKLLALPREFVQQLAPYVQDKFLELWTASRQVARRYVRIWRNKFLTLEARSLDDMIATLRDAAAELRAMRDDGVELDPEGGTADDYAYLVTTDPAIAKKYGMEEEDEGWESGEEPQP